jgi:hypothetical protein
MNKPNKKQASGNQSGCACHLLGATFLLGFVVGPDDEGSTLLQNISGLLQDYTVLQHRRWYSS